MPRARTSDAGGSAEGRGADPVGESPCGWRGGLRPKPKLRALPGELQKDGKHSEPLGEAVLGGGLGEGLGPKPNGGPGDAHD